MFVYKHTIGETIGVEVEVYNRSMLNNSMLKSSVLFKKITNFMGE